MLSQCGATCVPGLPMDPYYVGMPKAPQEALLCSSCGIIKAAWGPPPILIPMFAILKAPYGSTIVSTVLESLRHPMDNPYVAPFVESLGFPVDPHYHSYVGNS